MMNSSWSQYIADTMKSLGKEFSQDELAYLALTSKVESPIRDRLAYSLHRHFEEDENIRISREWTESGKITRVDIAILEKGKPQLFLEIKSMYSFDMFKPISNKQYPNSVQDDLNKMKAYNSDYSLDKIAMILIASPTNSRPNRLDGIVPYNLWKYGIIEENDLKSAVKKNFDQFNIFASGRIVGGCAFGIGVNVHYWLFGPY